MDFWDTTRFLGIPEIVLRKTQYGFAVFSAALHQRFSKVVAMNTVESESEGGGRRYAADLLLAHDCGVLAATTAFGKAVLAIALNAARRRATRNRIY